MKSSAALNYLAPPDVRATPSVFQAAAQDIVKHVTALMCLHGIKSLHADIVQVGSRSVVGKDYVPLAVQPPPPFDAIQGEAAAKLIEYMTLFGIHSIDVDPTAEELAQLGTSYEELKAQALEIRQTLAAKTAPAQDPTGTAVT